MGAGANPQQTQAPQGGGAGQFSDVTGNTNPALAAQFRQQVAAQSGQTMPFRTQQTQAPQGQPNVFNQSAGAYNSALGGTQQGMNFRPQQASASGYNPATAGSQGYNPATAGSQGYNAATAGSQGYGASQIAGASPIVAQNVQAGQIAGSDLGAYTNPFETQVVDQALGDLERSRLIQQNQLGAQASASGAYGGSRQGIAEAETNRAFAEQAARTASGLRQTGFANAQQLAGQDIASRMQGSLANQGANLPLKGKTLATLLPHNSSIRALLTKRANLVQVLQTQRP